MERLSIFMLSLLLGVLIYSIASLHTRLAELDNSIHELNVEMCKLVPNNEKCKDI